MKQHQAFWPSVADALDTYGQPIGANMSDTTKALSDQRFWQEAYLTALDSIAHPSDAKACADQALEHLKMHERRIYSQTEMGSGVPYAPRDEVAGCLRGAITAMELLATDYSLMGALPGLNDLIARSKKALGDC